ncbi:Rod shape-determining protein MreD [Petrocella atlantisensis]|uniref:Rod shape-determining protein MreD n=1 Tax=Petrocella atlantisensis TaxID=2173034 RepID=A0A3P7NXC7_9FIRM|nr:rod shape-determining protein MreD [Petrocella atlantisensis]PKM54501.1 MAG: rod shape-determining protein MreD [Firmicutes bacterium HGW-Firmicutes-5]VDN45960.1 Rod shape-determining protein MreD [Petrocella atlantisensis]
MRKVQLARFFVIGLIILINFILQPILFQEIAFNGIVPNIFVITIVSFGLLRGRVEGAVVGVIIGLLHDIFYGDVIGFYALIYMYIGYATGFFHRTFYRESLLVPIAMIGIADFFQNFIVYFFTFLFRGQLKLNLYFSMIIIPELIYSVFVGFILYRIYYFINLYVEKNEWLKENED